MPIPFVTSASEKGIALDFSFPGSRQGQLHPLGFDLWSSDYAVDSGPLSSTCSCYTCTRHHKAYLHHLLQAKEMLGWTLLQIHNYSVMDRFFLAIRESIARASFDQDMQTFAHTYEPELPEATGEGPRIRGYQTKSVGGGEPKLNPKAYGRSNDALEKLAEAESGIGTPTGDSSELEEHGFGQKT